MPFKAIVSLAAAACVLFAALQPQAGVTAIAGGVLIDGTGSPARPATIVIRDGAIESILDTAAPLPEGATVVRADGKFLIPGLWDMHVHLAVRPEPELAERTMLPLFLANGIVGVRDMGGPRDRVLKLRADVASGALPGPRIITPGPFLDGPGDADPAFRRVTTAAEAEAVVAELQAAGVDFLKVQAGLSPVAYHAILQSAKTHHIDVVGHVPISIDALDAIASGQRSVEHISPAIAGDAMLLFACSRRSAELLGELRAIEHDRAGSTPQAIRAREVALRRQLVETFDPNKATEIGRAIAKAGGAIVPTLIWSNSFRPLSATDDGSGVPMEFVPAATRQRWQQARANYLKAAGPDDYALNAAVAAVAASAVGAMHTAGARVLAGTDTFDYYVLPGSALHAELALLVGAGLTPMQALQCATKEAAAFRGTLAREGTIERGKAADVALLDANPLDDIANVRRVHAVVQRGRLLARTDLDALLNNARPR